MFDSTQEAQGWGVIQTDASPAWSITNGPYSTGTAFEEDPMFHFENAVTSGLFDPSSANKLLRLVGVMIVRGDDVPPAIRRWLGCALIAIGLGAPPASTLRIGAKKGRPARVDWQDVFSRFHPRFASGMALHTGPTHLVVIDRPAYTTRILRP